MAGENGTRGLIDPDLVERLKDISDDTKQLIQQEVALAKAEILQKVDLAKDDFQQAASQLSYEVQQTKSELVEVGKKAGIGAGLFSGAGLFGLAAFGTLTAALIAGLAEFLPVWGSALIVTALYGIVAGILAMAGKAKVQQATDQLPAATQHVDNMKGVVASAKDRIQQDVPLAPEMTIESLKGSKDKIADAWKKGSTEQQPPWKSPGLGRK
ncbi:MAG TPA: phage holin family protein [Actinomycetota bacterium]|nr:phage holin family protein [Actinomycetota bacterium]